MKIYISDYWGNRTIVLGNSSRDSDLIAIGEVLDDGGENYIHIKKKDLLDFMKKLEEKNNEKV